MTIDVLVVETAIGMWTSTMTTPGHCPSCGSFVTTRGACRNPACPDLSSSSSTSERGAAIALSATGPIRRPPPEVSDADEDATGFSQVEKAIIRNTVEDHASRFFGGPLNFGTSDAVRYTTEVLMDRQWPHSFAAVSHGVSDAIAADPSVLELTPAQRQERQKARQAGAAMIMNQALDASRQGDRAQCLALIDKAELVDPTYEPAPGITYEWIRNKIHSSAAALQQRPH